MLIQDSDFRFEWYSGTGNGGQFRNKHQNCCRCIHVPTGITAVGTSSRSRNDNQRAAMQVCKARVADHFHVDKERWQAGQERIRTYHEPDNRVVDHLSGFVDTYTNVVVKANMEEVIEARATAAR